MKRIFKLTLIFFAPYFAFVLYLAVRGPAGVGRLPHWIWGVAFCYFVAGILAIGYWGRARRADETVQNPDTKAASSSCGSSRALKIGLILYVLILLNGLRLVVQGSVPLRYAIPGLIVDVFLLAVFWWLLVRGRNQRRRNNDLAKNPER